MVRADRRSARSSEDGLDDALTALLGDALERELIADAALAATLEQREAFWRLRESMSDAQKPQGGSIKHDVSTPVGAVPAFIAEATAAVAAFMPAARVVAFGHLGDGNTHFNVSQPIGADKEAFLDQWSAMNEVVHAVVARHAGSISAEHGIGALKRELLKQVKDPVALDLMRAVKARARPARPAQPRQGSLIRRSALEFRRFARQEADMRARGAKRRSTAMGWLAAVRRADGSSCAARRAPARPRRPARRATSMRRATRCAASTRAATTSASIGPTPSTSPTAVSPRSPRTWRRTGGRCASR